MADESTTIELEHKSEGPIATVYVKTRKTSDDNDDDDDDNEDVRGEDDDDSESYDSAEFSSHGGDRLTDIESRVSKSLHRVSKSFDKGVTTYLDARDESKSSRRDGAIVDLVENASRGVAETLSGVSPVLTDVANAFNTKNARRQIRRVTRVFGRLPLL